MIGAQCTPYIRWRDIIGSHLVRIHPEAHCVALLPQRPDNTDTVHDQELFPENVSGILCQLQTVTNITVQVYQKNRVTVCILLPDTGWVGLIAHVSQCTRDTVTNIICSYFDIRIDIEFNPNFTAPFHTGGGKSPDS